LTGSTFSYLQDLYEYSEKQGRLYAQRCNADYYLITDPNDWKPAAGKHLAYQKLKVYDFAEYDQICYFDSDYIIKNNAPNIFDLLGNKFAAVADPGDCIALAKRIDIPREKYINTGFMYFTKEVLEQSRDAILNNYIRYEKWKFKDQCLWSKAFYDLKIDFLSLDANDWNPSHCVFGKYADHYSGANKNKWDRNNYE
jgi:alpha-N-acetylglucosamine transferase